MCTGEWPNQYAGAVADAPGETWPNLDLALRRGLRGLPPGSSLPRLLEEHRAYAGGPRGTRTPTKVYGRYEMTKADHRALLDVLRWCKGKVMPSGYPSALYDGALAACTLHSFHLPNTAAGGRAKGRETEVLWCNY